MAIPDLFELPPGTPSAQDLNDAFYEPKIGAGTTSFEVLNGRLGSTNLDSSLSITDRKIQPNCVSYARMAGLTGNLTYADCLFTDSTKNWEDFLDVPGCAVTVPVRMNSLLIFSWQIGGAVNTNMNYGETFSMPTNDLPPSSLGGCLALKISRLDDGVWNDVAINPVGSRAVPPGSHSIAWDVGGHRKASLRVRRPHRDRFWQGSYIYHSTGGSRENVKWYSARIVCHNQWNSFRIRSRNMKAIVMKYEGVENSTTITTTPSDNTQPAPIGDNPTSGRRRREPLSHVSKNENRNRYTRTLASDVIL